MTHQDYGFQKYENWIFKFFLSPLWFVFTIEVSPYDDSVVSFKFHIEFPENWKVIPTSEPKISYFTPKTVVAWGKNYETDINKQ